MAEKLLLLFLLFSSVSCAAKHTEIWRIAISMEGHKSEIDNWEFGAGVYISFYLLRNSLQEDNSMTELVWKLIYMLISYMETLKN